uniref:Uncharacterized protein n=1 Tax=Chromera velia CCMP2878 TaxID=1169474 RepID=A0A0G4F3N7_9ALVE|eukprot:Cvel_14855.t1-p1 / transcript=Cvel_14855.t1 / gene=Cvel_14855 / organism=Chromera_velia_CCMP2878 / gene_product=Putative ankyrin repeat domain-containing protein, putative / transcript_product=Putative ankyrin repeat domain-containing protein, putative / location=Cvel_scaffold1073:41739-42488(+) / protein_length=193 / sequence_SO=supercontig / SO=protein_coding / is_pseudo=false
MGDALSVLQGVNVNGRINFPRFSIALTAADRFCEDCAAGRLEAVQQKLANKSAEEKAKFVCAKSREGDVPLNCAAHSGNLELVDLLLESGASLTDYDKEGHSALCSAILGGHPQVLQRLVEKGGELNHQDDSGLAAVHYAVLRENVECAKILLEAGANPNLKNKNGTMAFQQARVLKNQQIQELLKQHGAIES